MGVYDWQGLRKLLERLDAGEYDETPLLEEMSGSFLVCLLIDAIPALNRTRLIDDDLTQYCVNFGKTTKADERTKNVFWRFAPLPAEGGRPVLLILTVEQVLKELSDMV